MKIFDTNTTRRRVLQAFALSGLATAFGLPSTKVQSAGGGGGGGGGTRIAADPTDIPPPITRSTPMTHNISLDVVEKNGVIAPGGITADFMTFGGQVPGPMIRVMVGDTVYLTLNNLSSNALNHNIDLHAVYGPGGGADATLIGPGQSKMIKFKCMYPGCFIYHCAVPNDIDCHIAHGMFGLILVEPVGGLPPVNREFYLGQNEYYNMGMMGGCMGQIRLTSDPDYVTINGAAYALTDNLYGPMQVNKGETARIYFGVGGPNRASSFHPIGNVWSKVWRDGRVTGNPEEYLQTVTVAPGNAVVCELNFPVPGPVKLVDHAISTLFGYGALAIINVSGTPEPDIYDPNP